MSITLEQARVLDAVAKSQSLADAAKSLKKGHTSVVYALKTMEDALGVELLDRTGYRSRLTVAGEEVLILCQRLLETEGRIGTLAHSLRHGWEAKLTVVYDGLLPANNFVLSAAAVQQKAPEMRVSLFSEYLSGVEERFLDEKADLMVSLLPPSRSYGIATKLPKLKSLLVASRSHKLAQARKVLGQDDLEQETFLTVRGSDQRLSLSTISLDQASTFHLSDFVAKKSAILAGVGFGWMPEYLVEKEIKKGLLKVVKWQGQSVHEFSPVLYSRSVEAIGRAVKLFTDTLLMGGRVWDDQIKLTRF